MSKDGLVPDALAVAIARIREARDALFAAAFAANDPSLEPSGYDLEFGKVIGFMERLQGVKAGLTDMLERIEKGSKG